MSYARADLGDRRASIRRGCEVDEDAQAVVGECGELHAGRAPTGGAPARRATQQEQRVDGEEDAAGGEHDVAGNDAARRGSSISGEWITSGDRAYHRPFEMLSYAW
jgi:hypothetical protein